MKKLLVIVTLGSFMFAGEMGLSAYGGMNLGSIAVEDCDDCSGIKPGLILGVQYNKLPVILGVGISQRGNKMEVEYYDMITKITESYMYLDLSAIYPYAVGPGNVFAGLDIGMNLSATNNSEITGDGCTALEAFDMDCTTDDDIEDVAMDFGLTFGYTYPINETMGVSASYYMGLAEIVEDSKTKHNGIGVGISYLLPF